MATKKRVTTKQQADEERRLQRIKSWRDQEIARQSSNRFQMALDEDFYDGMQWDPTEAQALLQRGQNPVVYNEVKPTVDWLIGTERRTRTDFKVTPTAKGEIPAEDAVKKTKLLKYLSEVNRSEFTRSHAFDEAVKAGLGWVETGIKADPEDEPVFDRAESWRNVLYDSLGTAKDLSDSRYLFRMRWLDLDIAQAYFPEKASLLEQASEANPDNRGIDWWFGRRLSEIDPDENSPLVQARWSYFDAGAWLYNPRDRVQCYEAWYYEPSRETTGTGSQLYDRVRMRLRCTVFTDVGILWDDWSPYQHNRFPLVPVWCYRRKRDGAPYGVVRNIRGPQESLNKRMSKSLFILSTNRVHVEAGAIDDEVMDEDELREELAAPDALTKWADGALQNRRVIFEKDTDVAQGHLAMAERDKTTIREVGGVTSESLGRDTNLVSGVALKAKHDQGAIITLEVFDNLRLARQLEGEIKLSLIEQYYTEPKVFRITGERSRHDFVEINEPDPVTGEILNPITATKATFVIDEQDFRESLMQAMFEQLMDMLGKIAAVDPQFARNVLDIVLEYSQVPGASALVKRIRALTGQVDPDEEDSPKHQQKKQAQEEAQQALQQKQIEAADAVTAEKKASAELKMAQVGKTEAEIGKLDADRITRLLEGIYAAMQSGQLVAVNPGVAPVGDELLKSAGFKDQNGQPTPAPAVPVQPVPGAMPGAAPAGPPPANHQTGMMAGSEIPGQDGPT